MKTGVIGGGLAGTLLAWRLAKGSRQVELISGGPDVADATAASGGGVRAYETHPVQRALAVDSLRELLASRVLRDWADYRRTGSTYLRAGNTDLGAELAQIDRALFGSVGLVSGEELARDGWAGLPDGTVAVVERFAGYVSPNRLRGRVLAELAGRRAATVLPGRVSTLVANGDGTVTCRLAGGGVRRYDAVVVAAGAWTPALLQASGLPTHGMRTKVIQYAVYRAGGWRPTVFVDETSGLYGRPTADGSLLLGLPTQQWDAHPGTARGAAALHERAARLALTRLPKLRLGPARSQVAAIDCYTEQPVLRLRRIGATPGLFTFTGGSGGSVKTALAASRIAADHLAAS